jgi:ribosomal protein S6--L-glutamate ligase
MPPSPASTVSAARKPRIAVVGSPGKWSSECLADALHARTGFRAVVELSRVRFDLTSGSARAGDLDLAQLDGVMVKKLGSVYGPELQDRVELLELLCARGVRVFSPPAAMAQLVSRLGCTVALVNAGLPMPRTIVTEDEGHAVDAVLELGAAVLKPLYSTKAQGMRVVEAQSRAPVAAQVREFRAEGNAVMYLQQRAQLGDRDLGVVFIGERYLGSYARVRGAGAWNTTTRSGGHYQRAEPGDEIIALADRARRLFGLDFTAVDVAISADGPIVFEVSAFGGFRGLEEGCGIDAAGAYADYAIEQVTRG